MESAVFEIEVTSWGYLAVVFWSLFPLLFSVGYTVAFRRRLYHRFWFAVLATVCGYVGYAGIQSSGGDLVRWLTRYPPGGSSVAPSFCT